MNKRVVGFDSWDNRHLPILCICVWDLSLSLSSGSEVGPSCQSSYRERLSAIAVS